jgi:hypothetical protein
MQPKYITKDEVDSLKPTKLKYHNIRYFIANLLQVIEMGILIFLFVFGLSLFGDINILEQPLLNILLMVVFGISFVIINLGQVKLILSHIGWLVGLKKYMNQKDDYMDLLNKYNKELEVKKIIKKFKNHI